MVTLGFKNKLFEEVPNGDPNEYDILLTFDEDNHRLIMKVSEHASFIDRRTAERQARGISKTGYMDGQVRIGFGYELVVEGNGGEVPKKLHRSPREVY